METLEPRGLGATKRQIQTHIATITSERAERTHLDPGRRDPERPTPRTQKSPGDADALAGSNAGAPKNPRRRGGLPRL
jgi:hypothetical protein